MKILNLGCGTKTSASADVINIDWSIYLRIKKNRILRLVAPRVIKGEQLSRFQALPDNIMVHDLAKGLPFASDSIDAVYHSHSLEHLDRDVAKTFLLEVKRVLKPGGVHRIVVPDMEKACRAYISHIPLGEGDAGEAREHDSYVAAMIEQSVRTEAYSTRRQKPVRRFVENTLLGDARRRGETHQWMYDRINLGALLVTLGYRNPQRQGHDTSLIPNWNQYGLDVDEHGNEYKPESLYIEARK